MKFDQYVKTDKGMPTTYFAENVRFRDNSAIASSSLRQYYKASAGTPTEGLLTVVDMALTSGGLWIADTQNLFLQNQLVFTSSNTYKSLTVDENDSLIAVGKRYVSRTIPTTLTTAILNSDTSLTVDDVTDFPSSGEVVVFEVSESFAISIEVMTYTGISSNTLTGLTRGVNHSNVTSHSAGSRVIGFIANCADLGADNDNRPVTQHENHIFIGNKNYVAGWDDHDTATFSTNKLDLPTGYEIISLSSSIIGNQRMVLIGAQRSKDSALFVWDGEDTTWIRKIDIPAPLYTITGKYIITEGRIYKTDGYTVSSMTDFPSDQMITEIGLHGADNDERYLYLASGRSDPISLRNRGGLWIMDLQDKTFRYSPLANLSAGHGTCVFARARFVYVGGENEVDMFSESSKTTSSSVWVPFIPNTGKQIKLTDILLDVGTSAISQQKYIDFDVVVRVAALNNSTGFYAQVSSGISTSSFSCSPTTAAPLGVGDRVEFYPNQIRNIIDISSDENPVITLDGALSSTPADYSSFLASPNMKKITTIHASGDIDPEDMHVVVKNQPVGFGFMVEVEFRSGASSNAISPSLRGVEFIGNTL